MNGIWNKVQETVNNFVLKTINDENSYETAVERFGTVISKGIVQFKEEHAYLVIANSSSKEVTLPIGTIMASLEFFDEKETIDWIGTEDHPKFNESQQNKTAKYIVLEEECNKYLNWKPRQKQKNTNFDDRSKLINTIELEIQELKTNDQNKEVNKEASVREGEIK